MAGHGWQDVFVAALAMSAAPGWMDISPVACGALRPVPRMSDSFFAGSVDFFYVTYRERCRVLTGVFVSQ